VDSNYTGKHMGTGQLCRTVVALVVIVGTLGCRDSSEDQKVKDLHQWAVKRVEASPLSDTSLLLKTAQDHYSTHLQMSPCEWKVKNVWGESLKNPNWSSRLDGVTGFLVTCNASVKGVGDDMVFEWRVGENGVVSSFRLVGWAYIGEE
jgi:hypothetical protein